MRFAGTVLALIVVPGCGAGPSRPGAAGGPVIAMAGAPGPLLGAEPPAQQDVFGAAWLAEVHTRLHEKWSNGFLEQARVYLPASHPLNTPTLVVVLSFTVSAEGGVKDTTIVTTSGVQDFDRSAFDVVSSLSALPPPPPDLLSDDGLTHVTWTFARDDRQDGLAGAAIDRRLLPPPQAVPALIAAGRIDDAADRAATSLAGHEGLVPLARDIAGQALVTLVTTDKDPTVRVAAARGLGASGWHGGDGILRKLGVEANDLVVQAAALRALGDLGDASAESLCREVLTRSEGERGAAAAYALGRLGKTAEVWTTLAPRIDSADASVRIGALVDLAEVGVESSTPAVVRLLGGKGSRAERTAAARALVPLAIGGQAPATRALIQALTDGDAAIRAAAVAAIAEAAARGLRGNGLFHDVEPLLRDRDPRVQASAIRAGALLDGKAALPELTLIVARSRDAEVVAVTVAAIGAIPGPEALASLRRSAKSENPDVRAAALRALSARPEPEARAVAATRASDPDDRSRAAAIAATTDGPKLEAALADPDPGVREAAAAGLTKAVGDKAAASAVMARLATTKDGRGRVALAGTFLRATRPTR